MDAPHRAQRVERLDLAQLGRGSLIVVNAGSAAEVVIDGPLVRELLSAQCPVLRGVDVRELEFAPFNNGWDNDIWSLGDEWLVRLPRRAAAAGLVLNEQKWLPVLAPHLSLPVPVPVFAGVPQGAYPWHWSVVPRFAGDIAARSALADPEREAERLALFLRELHRVAPPDAPTNPFRGLPVADIQPKYRVRRDRQLDRLESEGRDAGALDHIMEIGLKAPVHRDAPVWLHGDMHIGNVLVDRGALSAVVDWGDVCSGDPACDLQIAWMMFDADARDVFFGAYGEGAYGEHAPGLAMRSRAWAAHSALVYLDNDEDDPVMTLMAHTVLDRLLAE